MNTNVYIIIVTQNQKAELKEQLPHVLKQLDDSKKVLVVDNGSTDGTKEFLKETYKGVLCIENKANLGFVKAINIGIQFAVSNRATSVVLLAPNILPGETFMTHFFEKQAFITTPIFVTQNKSVKLFGVGGKISKLRLKPSYIWAKIKPPPSFNTTPQFASFACIGLQTAVLEKVGLLDEHFTQFFADIDYCLRIKKKGIKITVEPKALVFVLPSSSKTVKDRQGKYFLRDYVHFATLHTTGLTRIFCIWYSILLKMKQLIFSSSPTLFYNS